jgi:hypothetical protein
MFVDVIGSPKSWRSVLAGVRGELLAVPAAPVGLFGLFHAHGMVAAGSS